MSCRFAAGLFLLGWATAEAAETFPASDPCEDPQRIASEYLEWELAGIRWQGGDSSCLAGVKTSAIRGGRIDSPADPALLDPEFVLPKKRKIEIKARRLPQDLIEVRFGYLAKRFEGDRRGQELRVSDELLLKLQFGRAREERGCAVLHRPPKHFVMREGCPED